MNSLSKGTLFTSLVFLASTLIFSSCKKQEIVPGPNPTPTFENFNSLADYFSSKEPQGVNFIFTAENGGTFTTSNGSVITIPPNAFVTPNGQVVTGTVDLRMKEVFTNHQMIHSKKFPISFGNALNSGGQFFMQASQNGVNLLVADGAFIDVKIPAQALDNQMELFLGGPFEDLDTLNWNVVDTMSNSNFAFSSADNSYEITLDTLGWGNIDAFMNINYFDCTFNLTGLTGLNSSNTTAFAVFKNENTVWPVGTNIWGNITNNTISENHLGAVPLNLVVISVVDGQLYSGILDITPQQGVNYSIALQETTSAALDQLILSLP